jgi:hypothetical protein
MSRNKGENMDLIPIKVKIGLRSNRHADHPDWTKLSIINDDSEMRQYAPYGWMYDKSCGHNEVRAEGNSWDSPHGIQWGCLLVTRAFADEAIATFPLLITELTEAEFQDFYDNKSMANLPEMKYDINTLQGLKAEHDLMVITGADTTEVKARITKAVDPNDNAPGVRANKIKKWTDFKGSSGIAIK